MRKYSESIMKVVFLIAACVSIIAVILICVFLFASGVPAIKEIGISDFLLGNSWKPNQELYGIFPMIIGSIYVTAGSIIIGVPIGLLCSWRDTALRVFTEYLNLLWIFLPEFPPSYMDFLD